MSSLLDTYHAQLAGFCRDYAVKRLAAFGSVVRDNFGPTSDVDLLVEFNHDSGMDAFEQYFGFKERVEALLQRPIDLVTRDSIRNPAFRAAVEESQESLYVAA